ncbi:hypothetical protein RIF29_41681 [Crotalaria pallida]|uniref:Uncharacterized protein n=1 Tax=Crotalaria pallida TaxID=3830 RepID=A0AAN9HRV7_CROPI
MPSANNQSPSPFSSFGFSLFGIRRGQQIHSLESNGESGSRAASYRDLELESFQKLVTDKFQDLCGASDDELLSIDWIKKLLDAFTCCHDEFRTILWNNKEHVSKSPMDKSISEFMESWSVKALDICNNTSRDAIQKIRMWLKHIEIFLFAMNSNQRALSEGQFQRARKALMDSALAMLDVKDAGSVISSLSRRSFGQRNAKKDNHHHHLTMLSQSRSWSVSQSWSATKQLQSIASNLVPPRVNEIVATGGLATLFYTMNSALLFVLFALVASVPSCQDRGLNIQFSVPRQFLWRAHVTSLYERIMDESRKRENRNSNGLLKEIKQVERCSRRINEIVDSVQFPLTDEQKMEVELILKEFAIFYEAIRDGLDPLESHVRAAYNKINTFRTEWLDYQLHFGKI